MRAVKGKVFHRVVIPKAGPLPKIKSWASLHSIFPFLHSLKL